jgi:hypothetical protein
MKGRLARVTTFVFFPIIIGKLSVGFNGVLPEYAHRIFSSKIIFIYHQLCILTLLHSLFN